MPDIILFESFTLSGHPLNGVTMLEYLSIELNVLNLFFSWDWGPAFPSVGIWQDIHIHAFEETKLAYVKWGTV